MPVKTKKQSKVFGKKQIVKAEKPIPVKPYVLKEFEKPAEISTYYGFTPIKTPEITKEDLNKLKAFKEPTTGLHQHNTSAPDFHQLLEEKIAIFRNYFAEKMNSGPQPVMIYYKKPLGGVSEKKNTREHQFGLEILGSNRSVAEAVIIKAALAILEEEGYKNVYVDINSVGDRESMNRFERELNNYCKKNSSSIPNVCRQLFKKDIYEILKSEEEKCLPLKENAPKAMSCLSELSRQHFKEVLEFLETLDIPYKVNNTLLGSKNYCSHTIFEIRATDPENKEGEQLLALGMRYNLLAKKLGSSKDVPAIGISFCFKKINKKPSKKISASKIPKPRFYFVQLGYEAKLKSLNVLDELRKARIPVCHCLTKDMCVSQIGAAENMKLPYVIIMGQREALENTVVVRNAQTRVQETVPIKNLAQYLKKLKK